MAEGNNSEIETPVTQEPEDQAETQAKKTLAERLKNTLKRKKLLAAGGLAGLATLAGVAGFNAAQEDSETETPVTPTPIERTIEPTVEPTQVVEITPTPIETPTPQQTEIPSPTEQQAPKDTYESIRITIENSQLAEEQKTQAEHQLEILKGIEDTRQQFINRYKETTDANGQPLLLTLIKQKYEGIDPSTLIGFDPHNPDVAYENTIFFLKDQYDWENTTAPQLALLQSEQDAGIIAQKLTELTGSNSGQFFYLEANTKKGLNVTANADFTPQTEEERHLLEQTIAHIGSLKEELPLYGNIEFRINNSNINNHNYLESEDKTIINITLENPAISAPIPLTHAEHEVIHALDCSDVTYWDENGQNQTMENSVRCVRYLPPEKVVDALIAREAFLSNQTVGRKYPMRLAPAESFQIQVLNPQITAEEASRLANDYATQRYEEWTGSSSQERIDRTDSEVIAQFGAVRSVFDAKLIKDEDTRLFDDYINIIRNN